MKKNVLAINAPSNLCFYLYIEHISYEAALILFASHQPNLVVRQDVHDLSLNSMPKYQHYIFDNIHSTILNKDFYQYLYKKHLHDDYLVALYDVGVLEIHFSLVLACINTNTKPN